MELNMLDYFILLVLILGGIAGYHHGFIRTVGGLVSLAVGLWVAASFCDDLALYLETHFHTVSTVSGYLQDRFPLAAFSPFDTPVLPVPLQGVELLEPIYTNLAYLLAVAVSFLVLYLVVSRLSNLIWALISWMLGWGILGGVNRIGGLIIGAGYRVIGLAIALGFLYPLLENGAKVQLGPAIAARVYLDGSALCPYLHRIFAIFTQLTGLSL